MCVIQTKRLFHCLLHSPPQASPALPTPSTTTSLSATPPSATAVSPALVLQSAEFAVGLSCMNDELARAGACGELPRIFARSRATV